jgi:flagellar basal-body rod protein FlgB
MDLGTIKAFNMLEQKMMFHANRQEVISRNIANADTPGYRRRDINEPEFKKMLGNNLGSLKMKLTDGNHMTTETSPINDGTHDTGKKVRLDVEAYEMMTNSGAYAQATSTYKKLLTMIKDSVKGGN